MLNQQLHELARDVAQYLDAVRCLYAVTGSIASTIHGDMHSSLDVDVCVRMTEAQARRLHEILPQKYYRSLEAMIEAVKDESMVNLVEIGSSLKVDLSVLPREPYFDSVFARRQVFDSGQGYSFWVVAPEDVILMKLLWRKDTQSQKQWENALAVTRTHGARLDWKYLNEWGGRLSVSEDLRKLAGEAGI